MHVERYERWFMLATFGVLVAAAAALIISVVGHHAALPEPAGRVDPDEARTTPPFDEPGLREVAPGEYELVMLAQAWQWDPSEVTVPAGSEVHFVVTTVDVIHGMRIPGTNANAMVIPGQITEITVPFEEEGDYHLICHEYCGIGHQGMAMTITVE